MCAAGGCSGESELSPPPAVRKTGLHEQVMQSPSQTPRTSRAGGSRAPRPSWRLLPAPAIPRFLAVPGPEPEAATAASAASKGCACSCPLCG